MVKNTTTTGALSIATAGTDYQAPITITTTGNSGAATFAANALNIPNYTLAGLGGIGLTSLSATAPITYNNSTGVFAIPVATSGANGYLASGDWSTFNGKMSNPMLAVGDIIYGGVAGVPTRLPDVALGSYLRSGGLATAPLWSTLTLPNTANQGDIFMATGSNAMGVLPDAVAGRVLVSGGGSDPSYSATPTLGINGTTTGQLNLANGSVTGTSVTIQNNASTTAYNFNLPATAGSPGQALISGGGVAAPMTWSPVATTSCSPGSVPYWTSATLANSYTWSNGTNLYIGSATLPTFTYDLEVNGSFKTGKIYHASDRRWKKNIVTLDSALAKVLALRGVSYEWRKDEFPNNNFADGKQIGVIAQEVEKVYPELVNTGKDGYKAVEYANLVAVLIEAVKAQQKLIDNQTAQINDLKADSKKAQAEISRMSDIQKQMDALQKQMAGLQDMLQQVMPTVQVK